VKNYSSLRGELRAAPLQKIYREKKLQNLRLGGREEKRGVKYEARPFFKIKYMH